MSIVLDRLLARTGKRWDTVRANGPLGRAIQQDGIPRSPEFQRIAGLPWRVWTDTEAMETLQEIVSAALRVPGGQQTARPVQAVTLSELSRLGSVLGAISVGEGKTLLSFLASTVLGARSTLLLIPAHLRQKTETEFDNLARHWKAPENLRILHYQQLGSVRYADMLERISPDLIVCDEVHWFKNLTAARTKRMNRYMTECPETRFLGMSGTITNRSLMDFHHILRWICGVNRMPLPATQSEARRWSLAVDAKVEGLRMQPGVLVEFIEDPSRRAEPTLAEVREAVGQRIFSTPGIIANLTDDVDASIHIHYYKPRLSPGVQAKMDEIAESGISLNGDVLMEPIEYWRHMRELSCGFYREWEEKAPKEWMERRQEFGIFVRKVIEGEVPGLDTPLQITNAIARGALPDGGLYAAWKAVEPMFKPNSVARWVDEGPMEDVITRALKIPTLIWVEHEPVGDKLMEMSGFRYFHHKGIDQHKTPIDSLKGDESIILSIESNKEGRNLQTWAHNDLVSPPPNGKTIEQVMGRTHRSFQEADMVTFDMAIGHDLVASGMSQAYADAAYNSSTLRKTQKLLLADTSGIKISKHKT